MSKALRFAARACMGIAAFSIGSSAGYALYYLRSAYGAPLYLTLTLSGIGGFAIGLTMAWIDRRLF